MDLLVPQSSGGTADGRRLTALTVRVFEIPRTPPAMEAQDDSASSAGRSETTVPAAKADPGRQGRRYRGG